MKKIKRALISVFDKSGLDEIVKTLHEHNVEILSTGGTRKYIENLGITVVPVEELTDYPSILGGRVKTLHPKVFGGILAMRSSEHLQELDTYSIPEIDLVIVDLYPFEETLNKTDKLSEIIEKIDIGGISLIRAAAKNFRDVLVIPSRNQYPALNEIMGQDVASDMQFRREMAAEAFKISSRYDQLIAGYLSEDKGERFTVSAGPRHVLRYGENPHQEGRFYGDLTEYFKQLSGKSLSYNNLNDVNSALSVIADMPENSMSCAVIKHTNTCGLAVRDTAEDAWKDALAGDPVSAFGGIIVFNCEVNSTVAKAINKLFYEVLIAPSFTADVQKILTSKKKRIVLQLTQLPEKDTSFKSLLGGILMQEVDNKIVGEEGLDLVTDLKPTKNEIEDMLFADICVKHLKSNAIAITRNKQLIGIGTGQTSRIDALRQAINKAQRMGFELKGATMASDAFFPFDDCVEIAQENGIKLVIQPGGSIRDKDSINYCNKHGMKMVLTGIRHFNHG